MTGRIVVPELGGTVELPVSDNYVRQVMLASIKVQGAADPELTFRNLTPERQTAMLHGTANVLRGLTLLGWTLIPPQR